MKGRGNFFPPNSMKENRLKFICVFACLSTYKLRTGVKGDVLADERQGLARDLLYALLYFQVFESPEYITYSKTKFKNK